MGKLVVKRVTPTNRDFNPDHILHVRTNGSQKHPPEVFYEKNVLKNVTKFTEKKTVPNLSLKKRLWHRCFPVNFANFLWTPFFIEHFRWLLLDVNSERISSQIAKSIIDLTRSSNTDSNDVTISFIAPRYDNLNNKANEVNNRLWNMCNDRNIPPS